MPLYDFICVDCGKEFEEEVKLGRMAEKCHQCESTELRRLPCATKAYSISGNNSASTAKKWHR